MRWAFDPPHGPNDVITRTPCRATPDDPAFTKPCDAEPRTLPVVTHQGFHFRGPEHVPPIGPRRPVPAGAEDKT